MDQYGMPYWIGEGRSSQFAEEWPHPGSRARLATNGEDWEWVCDNCYRLFPEYINGCPMCVKGHVEQPARRADAKS